MNLITTTHLDDTTHQIENTDKFKVYMNIQI